MGSRRQRKQRWCSHQTLTPLMEGPDPEMQDEGNKKESSWEVIREWFRMQRGFSGNNLSMSSYCGIVPAKTNDLRLLLGVLGCPLAPIPLPHHQHHLLHPLPIKDFPIETSMAHYVIQQYLAATGCLKQEKSRKNMYVTGVVKMICCETEISSGKTVKSLGTRRGENGCFLLWQMAPAMWSLELVVGGNKVIAGSDGKTVWRHATWLGTHVAKGPQRPLRRIIQGLDPKTTACLFVNGQWLGEKRIGDEECFVVKVIANREAVIERSEGSAEVIRHVLYGYFDQKSGLLVYIEDSHLIRVQNDDAFVYWETTIGSSIGEYREIDGVLIGHQGRAIATVFRFGEDSMQHSRTKMEEIWRIDDVVFDVPGLSIDYFIPPADLLHSP